MKKLEIPFLLTVCSGQEIEGLTHWVWDMKIHCQSCNFISFTLSGRKIWRPSSQCYPWWRSTWARLRRCSQSSAFDQLPQRFAEPENVLILVSIKWTFPLSWTSITMMSKVKVTILKCENENVNMKVWKWEFKGLKVRVWKCASRETAPGQASRG